MDRLQQSSAQKYNKVRMHVPTWWSAASMSENPSAFYGNANKSSSRSSPPCSRAGVGGEQWRGRPLNT